MPNNQMQNNQHMQMNGMNQANMMMSGPGMQMQNQTMNIQRQGQQVCA